MATAAEYTFALACQTAENARQAARAAAFAAYNYNPAGLATYRTALVAADVAYITSVNSAASTAGLTINTGYSGPLSGLLASIAT
jgi:hypothetical protein